MGRKNPRQKRANETDYFKVGSCFPDDSFQRPSRHVPVKVIKGGVMFVDGRKVRRGGWVYANENHYLLGTEYATVRSDIRAGMRYFWFVVSISETGEYRVLTKAREDGSREAVLFPHPDSAKEFVNVKIMGLKSRYVLQGHKRQAKERNQERGADFQTRIRQLSHQAFGG